MYAESLLQAGRHFASCCMRLSGTILSVLQYFSGSCVNAVGGVKSYYVSVRYNTFECFFFFLGLLGNTRLLFTTCLHKVSPSERTVAWLYDTRSISARNSN